MDEVLFRSSQKLESLQYQLGIAANEGKKAVVLYSGQTKSALVQLLNSPRSIQIQNGIKEIWLYLCSVSDEIRCTILFHVNPRRILSNITRIFGTRWTRRDVYFSCAGLIVGGIVGIGIGIAMQKNNTVYRYMQAVQCNNYHGVEATSVVEDAIAPHICGNNEVFVNVKAGSINIIDAQICRGYGKTIRRILSNYQYNKHDLPVTLGRDCSGIITDIGQNVTKFEIGDEVWLTAPFWASGTLSQIVVAPANRVSKKPKTIGFEGACSIPHAGSIALIALNEIKLNKENVRNKRILIQGGCTPVGCVLIQILKVWGANITTTCFKRAVNVAKALGANEIIVLTEPELKTKSDLNIQLPELTTNTLIKELELKDKFDAIINTKECGLSKEQFLEFCNNVNCITSTLSEELMSDSFWFPVSSIFGLYIKVKCLLQRLVGLDIYDISESNLSQSSLACLAQFVECGQLHSVVDKVFHPNEVDRALLHIQSTESIGSTVITFR